MVEEKKFVLEQRVLGPRVQMEIDEDRYVALAKARYLLSDALAFEQGYELLLGNFIEMEVAFTEICLRATLEMDHRYPTLAGTLHEANRYVVNVLTSLRGYVDQVPQLFKDLDVSPKFADTVKLELKNLHSTSLDYRFVYELRNHAQHQGNAIHALKTSLTLGSDAKGWAESVTLLARKDELASSNFKLKVLAEQPDTIDVRYRVRMSMIALGGFHLKLRTLLAPQVNAARAAFDTAIDEYRRAGAESVVGLVACCLGDRKTDVGVIVEWDDVRRNLAAKNNHPPCLWTRPSSGEPAVADVIALRKASGDSVKEAASKVFVTETRWEEWEAGLPMEQGLFILYQLQVKKHPSYKLVPLVSTPAKLLVDI